MKLSRLHQLFRRLLLMSATIIIIFCVNIFVKTRPGHFGIPVREIGVSQVAEQLNEVTDLRTVREFLLKKTDYKDKIDISHVSRNMNPTAKTKSGSRRSTSSQANNGNIPSLAIRSLSTDTTERSSNLILPSQHQQQQQHGTANSSEMPFVSVNGLLQPLYSSIREINCSKLFLGDVNETLKAGKLRKTNPHKSIEPVAFISATKDCEVFHLERGYVNSVSEEERDFPLAYSILVHKSVEQFERLLRAIYRPNNYYCVHVDKKSKRDFLEAVKSIVECFPNVFIASKLEFVVYAGYTRLQADINCVQELYNNFSDWKYFLNMAGSEMPLKANLEMVQLLKLYNGSNLVGKNMKSINPWRWKNRYETVVNGQKGFIVKRNSSNIPPPFNLTMTKGSAYVILARDMVDFVLNDPLPQKFLEWSKSTYSPDEQFWATLNNLEHNPNLKTPGGNRCAGPSYMGRAVMWYSPNCKGKLVRSICVFGAGDLPWIQQRIEFVINKFDLGIDYVSYYCMEKLLQQRQNNTKPWDLSQHNAYLETHSKDKCGIPNVA